MSVLYISQSMRINLKNNHARFHSHQKRRSRASPQQSNNKNKNNIIIILHPVVKISEVRNKSLKQSRLEWH